MPASIELNRRLRWAGAAPRTVTLPTHLRDYREAEKYGPPYWLANESLNGTIFRELISVQFQQSELAKFKLRLTTEMVERQLVTTTRLSMQPKKSRSKAP
jgi:hypothetical protein